MPQLCGLFLRWTTLTVLLILLIAVSQIAGHPTTNAPVVSPTAIGLVVPTQRSQSSSGGPRPDRRHRHNHGANGQSRTRGFPRTIARPSECHQDAIFNDCFLCGKIAEDLDTYHFCCQRDENMVNFCRLLLTRRR